MKLRTIATRFAYAFFCSPQHSDTEWKCIFRVNTIYDEQTVFLRRRSGGNGFFPSSFIYPEILIERRTQLHGVSCDMNGRFVYFLICGKKCDVWMISSSSSHTWLSLQRMSVHAHEATIAQELCSLVSLTASVALKSFETNVLSAIVCRDDGYNRYID